ncbi:MAG: Lipid II:glycine glycyltransferase [candidate division WS6 bacterium OLB20]|uniref:Lipid II:glycine glycyltransferase n=1 Tax=candidate division WS6 bacterium OLB20 TaxID=1617426 RepID=A0A136LZB4_9BACT|nr:MAG: Lipid II:glycine glycyltransferase [candidate division WS6 bacterium OLB20]
MATELRVYNDPDPEWNRFIDSSPWGDILNYWQWGEVKRTEGWTPHRLALVEDGRTLLTAQMLIKPAGPLGNLAYVPHGPVFASTENLFAHLKEFTAHLRSVASDLGCFAIEIEPKLGSYVEGDLSENLKPFTDKDALNAFLQNGYKKTGRNMQPRYKLLYDLALSEEQLLGMMKKNTRYNVGYAERKGVSVTEYLPDDPQISGKLQLFYSLLEDMQERAGGYPIRPFSSFEKLLQEFKGTAAVSLFETAFEGDTIAINISERTGYWSSSFYAGSNRLHPNVKAMYLLRWKSVLAAKAAGCKVYDFWGIIPGSDQHKGYSDTKLSFGGVRIDHAGILALPLKPVQYMVWDKVLPLRSRLFSLLRSIR